jgi:hypothetical protein
MQASKAGKRGRQEATGHEISASGKRQRGMRYQPQLLADDAAAESAVNRQSHWTMRSYFFVLGLKLVSNGKYVE